MSRQSINSFLYRTRIIFVAAALLFILYGIVFLWFRVPFGSPLFDWQTDSRLVIHAPSAQNSLVLQSGDMVLAIDGQKVVRGRPFYPQPLAITYVFTILRGEETTTVSVPVYAPINMTVVSMLLPPTLLALAGWLVGAIMLFWSRRDNVQALHAGYIFLLAAGVLIGVQASLDGVPGAWAAHSLIFILAVGWVYLGTIPRSTLLPSWLRRLLLVLFVVAAILGVAMAYEFLFLFPRFTSFQEMLGISLYRLGLFLSSFGLFVCVLLLAWRVIRLPRTSYIRQQLTILLIFFTIGVFPAVLLTIIPRALLDVILLPFPLAITLMIFIPAGYLFVIYRKGMLGLDTFFSRTIYLALLSLIVFCFYSGGLYLVLRWLNLTSTEAMAPATIIFFPTLLLIVYVNRPIHEFVQRIVYGTDRLCNDTLAEITTALSASPELATLAQIVNFLTRSLQIPRALLLMNDEDGVLVPTAAIGVNADAPIATEFFANVKRPILRSAMRVPDPNSVAPFQAFTWAELLLPIRVRNEQVGLLVLARPGQDGYFNAHQLSFLTQVTSVLAVGSDNIILFEMARSLSREALIVREQERRQLAALIHDDPLQQITYAAQQLEQTDLTAPKEYVTKTEERLTPVVVQLRSAATQLRRICEGLYPPFWDQGIILAVQEIVHQFQVQHQLKIKLLIEGKGGDNGAEDLTASTCHILTECLNNVVKHGDGAEVEVDLKLDAERISLIVGDKGPGSETALMSYSDLLRQHHLGVVGMYEWARLAGGELRIDHNIPTGIKVRFVCQLHQTHLPSIA